MKQHLPRSRKQSGIALIALLVLTVLAAGYAFYRSTNIGTGRIQDQARGKLLLQLTQAKEALISYAVIDEKKPGRLLCPDLLGNGIPPLLARDDCEEYGGWLPWKTLDLTNASDSYGSNFRYHLSPLFGGDKTTPTLNSDTPTSLHLDTPSTAPGNDIVAIIIATRGSLDPRNADGDDYFYNGNSDSPDDNDLIIAVTRQELMAAVEQRIANEVRKCLEQHASSLENTAQTYPWPSPLSNTIYKGTAKSLFGMIPATQPGSNPDEVLKKSIGDLKALKTTLESASTAAEQLSAVQQLSDITAYARALYDRLYIAAADLESKAIATKNSFDQLDTTISSATTNSISFATNASTIPTAISAAIPSLTALRESLSNSGLDPFLIELQIQNQTLKRKIDTATSTPSGESFEKLAYQLNVFKNKLFERSSTPNPEITNLINIAMVTATTGSIAATNAKVSPTDTELANLALISASELIDKNITLYNTVQASRINIDGDEVSFRAERILTSVTELSKNQNQQSASALLYALETSRALTATVSTRSGQVVLARANTLSALDEAISAARAAGDFALIQSTASASATNLNQLATAMTNNGDNVAEETLKAVADTLSTSTQNAPATITAGRALRTLLVQDVTYWAEVTAGQAADIARLARKSTGAVGDSTNSAYTAAKKLLASLDGDTGTTSLLEQYVKTGSETSKQSAKTALDKTQTLLTNLLDKASILDASLESSLAGAVTPTVWYGSACSILKPSTGQDTWWVANKWAGLFFYQISDRVRPTTGRLTVNGTGNYRSVVLAAGKVLCQPDTNDPSKCTLDAAGKPVYWDISIRETTRFLEGKNQDTTRNGDAKSPVTQFSSGTVSPMFNDRLAY